MGWSQIRMTKASSTSASAGKGTDQEEKLTEL